MLDIIFLLIALAVLCFFIYHFIILLKRRRLRMKLEEYNKVLQHARKSRLEYVRVLENLAQMRQNITYFKEESYSDKARLNHFRAIIRDLIPPMREMGRPEHWSPLDSNVYEKKKEELKHYWHDLNELRIRYNQNQANTQQLNQKYQEAVEKEKIHAPEWFKDKSQVLAMYNVLSGEIKLPSPGEFLGLNSLT
jgi:hypothetical protein